MRPHSKVRAQFSFSPFANLKTTHPRSLCPRVHKASFKSQSAIFLSPFLPISRQHTQGPLAQGYIRPHSKVRAQFVLLPLCQSQDNAPKVPWPKGTLGLTQKSERNFSFSAFANLKTTHPHHTNNTPTTHQRHTRNTPTTHTNNTTTTTTTTTTT